METNEYLILGLLAFLGMFIHILMKVSERADKKNNKLSLKTWFADRMNWVRLLLSISSVVALILMGDDIANIMGITLDDGAPAAKFFAFGAGYLNHSLVRGVLKIFKTRVSENS
jgi:hypothetical protein